MKRGTSWKARWRSCATANGRLAGPGTFVFGPRNIPHGFRVEGDTPVRMLLLCAPGGFEQFVLEMSKPGHEPLPQVAAKYQVDVHGPLPARTSTTV
jgi:hypothetical protein